MLVLVLAAVIIALCGSLVSCQEQAQPVTLVMDTQYYDTNNNFIEIPMLAAHKHYPKVPSRSMTRSPLSRSAIPLCSPLLRTNQAEITSSCSPL